MANEYGDGSMIEMTLQLPDELAARIGRSGRWVPAILSMSLDGFATRAAAVASELIGFLSTNPSSEALLDYHLSDGAQNRLRRLLALNAASIASQDEQDELDELERIEHFVVRLKAQIVSEAPLSP